MYVPGIVPENGNIRTNKVNMVPNFSPISYSSGEIENI